MPTLRFCGVSGLGTANAKPAMQNQDHVGGTRFEPPHVENVCGFGTPTRGAPCQNEPAVHNEQMHFAHCGSLAHWAIDPRAGRISSNAFSRA